MSIKYLTWCLTQRSCLVIVSPTSFQKRKGEKKKRPNNLNLPEKLELLRFGDIYLFVDIYYMLFLTLWRINIQD